jgi:hypothetical protein
MANTLSREVWDKLLLRIRSGKCTPFLGAGVNYGILPTGSELARELATRAGYPFEDSSNLLSVTQYLAVTGMDAMYPKERTLQILGERLGQWERTTKLPDFFRACEEPLGIMAALPFGIYITTNYDDLIIRALAAHGKNPRRELCLWNKYIGQNEYVDRHPSAFDAPAGFRPTEREPVVFHLHGHDQVPESLVLTEDCYCDFMVNIYKNKKPRPIPPRIEQALVDSSLLFIGYRLADFDFHVIYKGLIDQLPGSSRRASVSVQLPLEGLDAAQREKQQEYLAKRFERMDVAVFWGTAKQFAAELWDRWKEYNNANRPGHEC